MDNNVAYLIAQKPRLREMARSAIAEAKRLKELLSHKFTGKSMKILKDKGEVYLTREAAMEAMTREISWIKWIRKNHSWVIKNDKRKTFRRSGGLSQAPVTELPEARP